MMSRHQTIYVGISIDISSDYKWCVAIALRDETYLLDFIEKNFSSPTSYTCQQILAELKRYCDAHSEKILGAALPRSLHKRMPSLCPQLWAELDILPIILDEEADCDATAESMTRIHFQRKPVDEQAESLSRKCIR